MITPPAKSSKCRNHNQKNFCWSKKSKRSANLRVSEMLFLEVVLDETAPDTVSHQDCAPALSEGVNVFISTLIRMRYPRTSFVAAEYVAMSFSQFWTLPLNSPPRKSEFHHWLVSQAKSSPCFESTSVGNAPNDVQCCVRRGG